MSEIGPVQNSNRKTAARLWRDAFLRLFQGEGAKIRRLRLRACLVMGFERLWPLVLPIILLVALFVSAAWFGLFALLPRALHIGVLVIFGSASLIALALPLRFRAPTADEITRRLEAVNNLAHEPLAVQTSRLATATDDPVAQALWREHQRRMAERLTHLHAGLPRPHIPERDPFALRAIVALLFVTAIAYSHSDHSGRLADAFRIRNGANDIPVRIDAWVTPPPYSGRAPIFLATAGNEQSNPIAVPQGSIVSVRLIGANNAKLTATDPNGKKRNIIALPHNEDDQGAVDGSRNFRHELQQDETIALSGTDVGWRFSVIPDRLPTIRFTKEPGRALNGTLQLSYEIDDDYPLAKAYAEIVPLNQEEDSDHTIPLFDPPDLPLTLPRRGTKEASTAKDLTEHPWAGEKVAITLVVVDGAGHIGRSETKIIILPERPFANPLARAIAEQRRILALDASQRDHVLDMLNALMLRPEETIKNIPHYLCLTTIRSRLRLSHIEDELRDTADYMWQVALGIEDGNLSAAERRLRQAQEALRNALQKGATPEEIAKLSEELRKAMQDFLREFAQRQQQNPNASRLPPNPNARVLSQKDLQRLMDQIEELAKQGARDQAEQLLSQLQSLLNNLQMAQPNGQGQGQGQSQSRQMQNQMNRLGDLMRRQQQNMNDTFALDKKLQDQYGMGEDFFGSQDGEQENGNIPSDMAETMRKLQQQQKDIQSDLQKLMDELKELGIEPGKDFSDAGDAMNDAAEALGRSETGDATDQQGEALNALRRASRDMMQKMQQAMGQEGSEAGQSGEGRDPLGRERGQDSLGGNVKIPGEIDIQRAREILDEIRRKLGKALTPQLEKEYLQRLLKFDQ